jgi:aspartyl-tRNA(Asn)/glutamyl-tRNA(Gln) amidotransferase subunit C
MVSVISASTGAGKGSVAAIIARTFDRHFARGYNDPGLMKEGFMDEPITREIFAHLVDLAALELEVEESEYLRAQLNSQLQAIRELEAIQVGEDVPITSHGVRYSRAISPPLRPDTMESCPEAEDILAQAPEVEDRYVVVPDMPQEPL